MPVLDTPNNNSALISGIAEIRPCKKVQYDLSFIQIMQCEMVF